MEKADKFRILAGMIVLGSIWGMLECILGSVKFTGVLSSFPMGALLGGFFGLGIMAFSRRLYGVAWMGLGMAIIAGLLRLWAPVGTCIICSALAIMAEGLIFELIYNRPMFNITAAGDPKFKNVRTLAFLGIISGYIIYVTGYAFTQIMTPILTTGIFNASNFVAALPLIFGRGFFAAMFGGIALPLAVLAPQLNIDISKIKKEHYYAAMTGISAFCWVFIIAFFHLL